MLVDIYCVDNIVYVSLTQRLEDLRRTLAELSQTAGAYTVISQELRSATCRLDVETELIETTDKRQCLRLVGIGDRYEDSTV